MPFTAVQSHLEKSHRVWARQKNHALNVCLCGLLRWVSIFAGFYFSYILWMDVDADEDRTLVTLLSHLSAARTRMRVGTCFPEPPWFPPLQNDTVLGRSYNGRTGSVSTGL